MKKILLAVTNFSTMRKIKSLLYTKWFFKNNNNLLMHATNFRKYIHTHISSTLSVFDFHKFYVGTNFIIINYYNETCFLL